VAEEDISKVSAKYGRYTMVEPLAKGGMAQIYKARTLQGRTFTLKKILKDYSDNADFVQMFLEEAKISLSLKHPNVVRVLDFGQIEGSYFLAMEYVFGRDVSALLKKCAESRLYIPMEVVCHIIYQCCLGLDYAHNMRDSFGRPLNIVHRDISPPNILMSYNGEVKILDFGIAKAISGVTGREETRSGVLKGKFSYMSPEQASGKPIDAQSDVFSLGTVFYELLTTRNLFYMPDEIETLERVRKAQVQPPSKLRKDIPSELDKVVMKALTLKTKNRYQSCAEMAEAIQKFLQSFYPRSDARSIAKFLRGVFSADFNNRFKTATSEGWQDILEVGGADDSLMLDSEQSSRSESRSTRSGKIQLSWIDRLLYDPKTKALFIKTSLKVLGAVALIMLGIFGYLSYRSGGLESILVQFSNPPEQVSEPPPTQAKIELLQEQAPVGSFAYWTREAAKAESEGDFLAALAHYNKALEINSFEVNIQARKNFILLAIGKIDEPCRWFQKKEDLLAEDKILSSAICHEANGNLSEAIAAYSDFLVKFPEELRSEKVRKVLVALKKKVR
jgi:serine/threonine protein kinase